MTRTLIGLLALLWTCGVSAAQQKPIALHPDNPHYLLWRDKPTVLITSTEHYGAVLNTEFDFIPYLDALRNDGLNLTRTFSGTYREVPSSFGITDNTLAPKPGKYLPPWVATNREGGHDGRKYDLTQFNPQYFARLKEFVAEAAKRGIVVEYVLFCPLYEDALWDANPMNAKNNINGIGAMKREQVYRLNDKEMLAVHEAFVRKAVAELKDFDNLFYEICNEPYFAGVADDWQAHIARVIADAQKDFPHKHLIAQNIANGSKKIERPNPLVSIFNFHYATPPDAVAVNYSLNKVIGDDETGFRGKEDVHYRTEAWEFLIAGGALYDNLDYSFTPAHPGGTFKEFKSPGGGGSDLRKQLGILKRFMEGFEFIKMKPMNQIIKGGTIQAALTGRPAQAIVTVRALGEDGKAYVIYIRGGGKGELLLNLPQGRYRAEWLDTKTGEIARKESFEKGSGEKKLAAPDYSEDIALRIIAEGK
jgi:hypothetical protein